MCVCTCLSVLQEAMTENGPYAWAYDASGISIGQLAPDFTGAHLHATHDVLSLRVASNLAPWRHC